MQNKLVDLNNHLFAELERLSDEEVSGEQLEEEIHRAKAVCSVSQQIIENGRLALSAEKMRNDYGMKESAVSGFLGVAEGK